MKCIILREGYLKRIKEMAQSQSVLKNDLLDLLELSRIVTMETIEAIVKWKKAQSKSHPFIWNGINYLLKIPSDFDYLQKISPLTSWLSFSMIRNPFILNKTLGQYYYLFFLFFFFY